MVSYFGLRCMNRGIGLEGTVQWVWVVRGIYVVVVGYDCL